MRRFSLRRLRRSSMRGSSTSASRAPTTIAVAQSASSTRRRPLARAACGAREEDDASGVARNLVEGPHELGLAAAVVRGLRDGGPQALVELAAEGLDQL